MIPAHNLLRLDAAGAFLTCVITGAVFATGLLPTGIPAMVLAGLALGALGLCVFGLTGLARPGRAVGTLRRLALLNATFCGVSAVVWGWHFAQLTVWGLLYFPLEIAVVLALSCVEWRVSGRATVGGV